MNEQQNTTDNKTGNSANKNEEFEVTQEYETENGSAKRVGVVGLAIAGVLAVVIGFALIRSKDSIFESPPIGFPTVTDIPTQVSPIETPDSPIATPTEVVVLPTVTQEPTEKPSPTPTDPQEGPTPHTTVTVTPFATPTPVEDYIVRPIHSGDTLNGISVSCYGAESLWGGIVERTNQLAPEFNMLKIIDPDKIYAGYNLAIPVDPGNFRNHNCVK